MSTPSYAFRENSSAATGCGKHARTWLWAALFAFASLPGAGVASAQQAFVITWENQYGKPVQYFWEDPNGKEIAYGELKPGAVAKQPSFSGANWVFRSTPDGKFINNYLAQRAEAVRLEADGGWRVLKEAPPVNNPQPGATAAPTAQAPGIAQPSPIVPAEVAPPSADPLLPATTQVTFDIENKSRVAVKLFRISPLGEDVACAEIPPGGTHRELTTEGQGWQLRSSENKTVLSEFTASTTFGGAKVEADQSVTWSHRFMNAKPVEPITIRIDASQAHLSDPRFAGFRLKQDQPLVPGRYLLSDDLESKLSLFEQGVLVLEQRQPDGKFKAVWESGTGARGKCLLALQADGNLVLSDYRDPAYRELTGKIWETGPQPEAVGHVKALNRNYQCFAKLERGFLLVKVGDPNGASTELWRSPNYSEEKNPIYRASEAARRALFGPAAPAATPGQPTVRNQLGFPPVKPTERLRTAGSDSPLAQGNADNEGSFGGSLRDAAGQDAEGGNRSERGYGGNLEPQGRAYDLHVVLLKADTEYRIRFHAVDNNFPPSVVIEDGDGTRLTQAEQSFSFKPSDYGAASGAFRLLVRSTSAELAGHYRLSMTPPAEKSLPSVSASVAQAVEPGDRGNLLKQGESLAPGQYLSSQDKNYRAVLQPDGNFEIRRQLSGDQYYAVQHTKTRGSGAALALLTAEGKLALLKNVGSGLTGETVWDSTRHGGKSTAGKRCFLKLLTSGNIAIYEGAPDENRPVVLWFGSLTPIEPSERLASDNPPKTEVPVDELPQIDAFTTRNLAELGRASLHFSQAAEAALTTAYAVKDDVKTAQRFDYANPLAFDDKHFSRLALGNDAKITFFRRWGTEITFFVASNHDTVILAFRGTETDLNWQSNGVPTIAHGALKVNGQELPILDDIQAMLSIDNACPVRMADFGGQMVHRGWANDLASVWDDVNRTLEAHQARFKTVVITGHSLGGALAGYAAFRLVQENRHLDSSKQHLVATFAAPRFAYKTEDGAPIVAMFGSLGDMARKQQLVVSPPAPSDFRAKFEELCGRNAPRLMVRQIEARSVNGTVDWVTAAWNPAGLVDNVIGYEGVLDYVIKGMRPELLPKKSDRSKILGAVEPVGLVLELPTAYGAASKVHDKRMSYYNVLEAFYLLKHQSLATWRQ